MVGRVMAHKPMFRDGAVTFIACGNEMDGTFLLPQVLQRLDGMIPGGYIMIDGVDAGVEEFLYLKRALVKGFFNRINASFQRLVKIAARFSQPDVIFTIIIVGQYAINIETKNRF